MTITITIPVILALVIGLVVAYLLGSIPSAVWIGKSFYGIDVREKGSKNAGATNTIRVLGLLPGIFVLCIDAFKGWLAIYLSRYFGMEIANSEYMILYQLCVGIFCVIGHALPIFAGFKGGKGVATVLGAVTGIQPNIAMLCFAVWFLVLMLWHYVSLASIVAGCSFPVFVSIFSGSIYARHGLSHTSISFLVFSFVVAFALVWTHR